MVRTSFDDIFNKELRIIWKIKARPISKYYQGTRLERMCNATNTLVKLASSNPSHTTTQKTQIASNSSAKVLVFHVLLQLRFYTVYIPHMSPLSPSSFFALPFNRISEAKGFFFVLKACLVISLCVPCDSRRPTLLFFFLCVSMLHICLPYLLFCADSPVLPAFIFRIPSKIRTAVATRKKLELMTHYKICSSIFQIKF